MAVCANSFPSCDVIYLPVIIAIAFEEGRLQGEVVLVYSILRLFGYKQMDVVLYLCFSLLLFPPFSS